MISDTAENVTILVVDDEESLRRLVTRIIEPIGYTCFQAGCGKDALTILEKEPVDPEFPKKYNEEIKVTN